MIDVVNFFSDILITLAIWTKLFELLLYIWLILNIYMGLGILRCPFLVSQGQFGGWVPLKLVQYVLGYDWKL